jgi:hypothetical protein
LFIQLRKEIDELKNKNKEEASDDKSFIEKSKFLEQFNQLTEKEKQYKRIIKVRLQIYIGVRNFTL